MLLYLFYFLITSPDHTFGSPLPFADVSSELEPGESSYYSNYSGKADPYPANLTNAILPTTSTDPGPDDVLFQNLLSAEWVVYSFYQQGVELYNTSAFVEAGFPNTTYDRLVEIRDNEAGHLKIFQDQISSSSVKPGACSYDFGFTDPSTYLGFQILIEISSMAYLTGLVLQADLNISKSALVAIAETESRHNTWALIDVWKVDPFAGPSDTIYPYADQILQMTNMFIINGSCPEANPPYPNPNQKLPPLTHVSNSTTLQLASQIKFDFPDVSNQPKFISNKQYYAVVFHGVNNFSMPYNVSTQTSMTPSTIEPHKGLDIYVIADEEGAPTMESVIAGPMIIVNQPSEADLGI